MKHMPLKSSRLRGAPRAAFTLVELLVVIGLIVLLAGGIGVALSGGNKSTALQSAQGSLSSALSLVRAQAALTGGDAALAVYAGTAPSDPDYSDRYLRYYVVIKKTTTGWEATGEGEYLPAGVYFVPNTAPSSTALLDSSVDFNNLKSDGFDGSLTNQKFNSNTGAEWLVVGISSLGRRVNAANSNNVPSSGCIMLATGEAQPPGSTPPFKYNNAYNVRGYFLSQYGVGASVNNRDEYNAYISN